MLWCSRLRYSNMRPVYQLSVPAVALVRSMSSLYSVREAWMYWGSRWVGVEPRSSMITSPALRRASSSWLVSAGFAWVGGCPCGMGYATGCLQVSLIIGEDSWFGLACGGAGEIFGSSGCPHWIRAVFASSLRSRLLACW